MFFGKNPEPAAEDLRSVFEAPEVVHARQELDLAEQAWSEDATMAARGGDRLKQAGEELATLRKEFDRAVVVGGETADLSPRIRGKEDEIASITRVMAGAEKTGRIALDRLTVARDRYSLAVREALRRLPEFQEAERRINAAIREAVEFLQKWTAETSEATRELGCFVPPQDAPRLDLDRENLDLLIRMTRRVAQWRDHSPTSATAWEYYDPAKATQDFYRGIGTRRGATRRGAPRR